MTAHDPADKKTFRKAAPAVFLIIYAIGALIYGHCLLAPFYFDDRPNITENPQIRMTRPTGARLADIPRGQPLGRALSLYTFAFNYYFHQYQVSGYRIINIFIHLFNAWLVACLCRQTLRRLGRESLLAPLLCGLAWLALPLHTQSVTYIVQRMNSLAALFYLLALVCYIQARELRDRGDEPKKSAVLFGLCGLAGLLGLVSKQTVATLPLFIVLYEWFFFQNLSRAWLKRHRRWPTLAVALCLLIAWAYLGSRPLERLAQDYEKQPFTQVQRLLTQPRVVVYYLSLLAWPHPNRLTLNYDFPLSRTPGDPATTPLGFTALIALLLLAVAVAKKHRLLSFGILWFLGNLAIESSAVGLALAYEHRLYLPSVFPTMALVFCLTRRLKPAPAAIGLVLIVIAVLAFWTYQRNIVWNDPVAFWQDGAAKAPGLAKVRNDYGLALAETGALEAARAEYEKALALPVGEKAPIFNNLGLIFYQTGRIDLAEDIFRQAIASQPTFAKAYTNLGIIRIDRGDATEAVRLLRTALALAPESAEAHNALARAYYESGQTDPALRHCRRAIALDPENADAENNLGAILLGIGRPAEALPHLGRVLVLSPDHPQANINIGLAYKKLGHPALAVFHLFRAVFLAPELPAARVELGLLLLQEQKYEEARTHLEKALELQPDLLKARLGLADLLHQQGLTDAAITQYRLALTQDPNNAKAARQLTVLRGSAGDGIHE